MLKIILSGCNGKMGRVITQCAALRGDCAIVAGIDLDPAMNSGYPVFSAPAHCSVEGDVIVDFSHPSALLPLLSFAKNKKLPVVVATTGLNDKQVSGIRAAAADVPVFYCANMSLGVSLLRELSSIAAKVLGASFDIEIIERHHNQKIDAPSGTALMLADTISEALPEKPMYVYDRQSKSKKRMKNEIGIHAVRGGTITGEHEVVFAGRDEVLTLSHSASSKEVFATGTLSAAFFLKDKPAGLYEMADLIG